MKRVGTIVVVLLYVACSLALVPAKPASASINPQISFQGKLTNPDGTNVTDSNYSIRFRIYSSTAPTDATNACSANTCQWEETQGSVAVSGGLFQVNLGSVTALPGSVDFNSTPLYLGVKVGSDAEMTPRIQLTAVPQAFNADKLDGIDSTGFIQLSPGSQQSGFININGAITSGAVNGLTLGSTIQPSSASALTVQSNGSNSLTLTGGAASTWSTSAGALTLTSAAAATWSTTAGNLTIQAGSGTISLGSSTVVSSTGALNLNSGAATALTVDSGTTGALNLGTSSNAKTITIGNTTGATSIAHLVGAGTNVFSVQGASSAVYLQLDTTNNRLYIGNPTADATAFLLILDSKNTTGDPTGVNGGEYYNSANNKFRCFENSVWKNCLGSPTNASVADQVIGASTTAYLTGSTISVSSSGVQVGSTFVWRITMSKTAAGTVANTFDVRVGTNGTTADTSRLSFAMGTETGVADTAVVVITATVRSVSATATMAGNYQMTHNLSITGFDNTLQTKTTNVTSGTFDDTTSGLKIGVSVTTGASYSLTFQQVQATTTNL